MKRFEKITKLPQPLEKHLQEINNTVIELICKRINHLSKTDLKKLENALQYAQLDLKKLENKLDNIHKKNLKEIDSFVNEVANDNVEFATAFYKAKKLQYIKDYRENKALNELVESIRTQTKDTYTNISNSLGFKTNSINKTIRSQYINIVDKAILSLATGTSDFYTEMRQSVTEMSKTGVKYVNFESGYNRRLDSQIAMNIKEGMSRLSIEMQNIMAQEYGSNGVEITAHSLCAPDHQSIQGKQFTTAEYNSINSNLKRPIGTLNCKHLALPILIGVSEPTYSKTELKEINQNSNKVKEYNGEKYTMYQASQKQRNLELKIRQQKEIISALDFTGDKIGKANAEKKLKLLQAKYKSFSNAMNLSLYWEKTKI